MLFWSILSILFGYSAAQQLLLPKRCSIYDSECQRQFFLAVRSDYASTGIPAIGVQPLDPLELATEKVNILNLWDLVFLDGTAAGVRNCDLPYFYSDVENRTKSLKVVCDKMVVSGRFKLIPSEAVKQSCCYNYNADGNITITLHQWSFMIEYPFEIVRRNGKLYFNNLFEKGSFLTDVRKVTTVATGIKYRNNDISEYANWWINQNWRLIISSTVGERIFKQSKYYYDAVYNKLYSSFVVGDLYTDNFENFVKN